MKEKSSLEQSLEILGDDRYSLMEAEVFAINNLSERKDIQEFYSAYLKKIEKDLDQECLDGKNNLGTGLIKKGYNKRLVAEYLANEHLNYTLEDMNIENFVRWSAYLPVLKNDFNLK